MAENYVFINSSNNLCGYNYSGEGSYSNLQQVVVSSNDGQNLTMNPNSVVLSNSSVNFTMSTPTSEQQKNNNYYLNANGSWSLVTGGGGGTLVTGAAVNQSFIGDGNTITYNISGGYSTGFINVYLNGVHMSSNEVVASDEKTIVFTNPPKKGIAIDVSGFLVSNGGGNSYVLPIASTTTLGGVKVDGSTIKIDGTGVISASGGGGGSSDTFADVKTFGAKGDGVTDDSAAFQAAIDSLTDLGGRVMVPPGRYYIGSTVSVKPYVSIIGPTEWAGRPFSDVAPSYNFNNISAILLAPTASFLMQSGSYMRGFTIIPKNYDVQTDASTWTGTAIQTLTGINDLISAGGGFYFTQGTWNNGTLTITHNGNYKFPVGGTILVGRCVYSGWKTVTASTNNSVSFAAPNLGNITFGFLKRGQYGFVKNIVANSPSAGLMTITHASTNIIPSGIDVFLNGLTPSNFNGRYKVVSYTNAVLNGSGDVQTYGTVVVESTQTGTYATPADTGKLSISIPSGFNCFITNIKPSTPSAGYATIEHTGGYPLQKGSYVIIEVVQPGSYNKLYKIVDSTDNTIVVKADSTEAWQTDGLISSPADDIKIENCMIVGFKRGIYAIGSARLVCNDLLMDCYEVCIRLYASYDTSKITRVHCWPFAHQGSIPDVYGRQDAFYYGSINMSADWVSSTDCFAYGYRHAYRLDSCGTAMFTGCTCDNATAANWPLSDSAGFLIENYCWGTTINNCQAVNYYHGIHIATDPGNPGILQQITNFRGFGPGMNYGIKVDSGKISVSQAQLYGGSPTSTGVAVSASATCYLVGLGTTGIQTPYTGNVLPMPLSY